jgi:hypothetical protein
VERAWAYYRKGYVFVEDEVEWLLRVVEWVERAQDLVCMSR